MPDTNTLIEALYNNFLLRDLFAKIVPGTTVLTVVVYGNTLGEKVVALMGQIGWPAVLVLAGLAWLVGFAVQDIGEVLRIIRHHPRRYDSSDYRYRRRIAFKKVATTSETQQVERYAIIKEASGNSATAIFLGIAILAVRIWWLGDISFELSTFLAGLLLLSIASALCHANRTHGQKQYNFIDSVLEEKAK